ncbi:MAG: response regulator [Candidatus Electryonea clarkiae]|nr:response regulator [Candidatus Electryonea clarkiae]MDP8287870.1 response regulator [Candidatus Electryonea clarkiae]
MRVLIAEDDLTSRKLLEVVLSKWGYEVVSASDGDEAWAELQEKDSPDLLILDWMMPGMDGVEICRELRKMEDANSKYIILLTALGSKARIVEGIEAGANDYITKPFHNDELRVRVRAGQKIVELQASLTHRISELEEALDHIKTLQGLIPICMYCRSIRDDSGAWEKMEIYIEQHSHAQFSHGICPVCRDKHFGSILNKKKKNTNQEEKPRDRL